MRERSFKQCLVIKMGVAMMLLNLNILNTADAADDKAPKVPFQYALGYQKYQNMCTVCHGKWGEGTKSGPPLMHPFYKPSHHNDASFYRAALRGVKAHHWKFGDMPPISGATQKDMDAIVPYVRWLQREKGVYK